MRNRKKTQPSRCLFQKVDVESTRGGDDRPIKVGDMVRCPAHWSNSLGVEVPTSPPGRVVSIKRRSEEREGKIALGPITVHFFCARGGLRSARPWTLKRSAAHGL